MNEVVFAAFSDELEKIAELPNFSTIKATATTAPYLREKGSIRDAKLRGPTPSQLASRYKNYTAPKGGIHVSTRRDHQIARSAAIQRNTADKSREHFTRFKAD